MKTRSLYELLAALAMMLGAVALVHVYFPIVNPGAYRPDKSQETAPIIRYIVGMRGHFGKTWALSSAGQAIQIHNWLLRQAKNMKP